MEYINSGYKNVLLFQVIFPYLEACKGEVYVSALCRNLSDLSLQQGTPISSH